MFTHNRSPKCLHSKNENHYMKSSLQIFILHKIEEFIADRTKEQPGPLSLVYAPNKSP